MRSLQTALATSHYPAALSLLAAALVSGSIAAAATKALDLRMIFYAVAVQLYA
jgi:hypothetical protein